MTDVMTEDARVAYLSARNDKLVDLLKGVNDENKRLAAARLENGNELNKKNTRVMNLEILRRRDAAHITYLQNEIKELQARPIRRQVDLLVQDHIDKARRWLRNW